jgi:hypothetical protein
MIASQRRTIGNFQKCYGMTAAVALSCGLLVAPVQAYAGACKDTKRNETFSSTWGVSAHTVVRNASASTSYDVTISRGTTEKESGTIAPGAQLAKMSGALDEGVMNVSIKPVDGSDVTACSYKIKVAGSDSWWLLDRSDKQVCGGAVKVTCNKSFHPSNVRWNTLLEIGD